VSEAHSRPPGGLPLAEYEPRREAPYVRFPDDSRSIDCDAQHYFDQSHVFVGIYWC
jgi:hypothetical protein